MHQGNIIFNKLDSIFTSFIFILTGLCFFLLKDGACLQINDLVVPDVVKNGTAPTVVLDCDYSLDSSDVGLVVKWFLNDGDTPVYQWIPPQRPQDLGKLKTLTSNMDAFCPMPQWDSISGTDLTGPPPPPYQDFYDSLADDGGSRGKRSLSVYYPPMVLPPSSLSPWHQCPVPQILTLDSSIMTKPLTCKTESLPMCVQMMEIPGTMGTPVCGPMTYEPEFSAEVMQPMMAQGMSAACTAPTSEEELPCMEVATEAPAKPEEEKPPLASEASEEPSPVAGLLAKVFTPSALAELSKFEEKTDKSEGSNVKRQTLPDIPLQEALPLLEDVANPPLDGLKTKLLHEALGDQKSVLSSLLPVLSLLGSAAKQAIPTSSCNCPSASASGGCSSHVPAAPAPAPPPALLGLDASVLGPKGLLSLDANVLKLLGLDLSLLGPKGVLSLDASVPNTSSPPAPAPALPASPKPSSANGGLLGLDASLLGPKGLLNLDVNILKLLGLDLSLLGPKGILALDASVPNTSPSAESPALPALPSLPPLPTPPALPVPASPKPSSGNGGLLGLDASLLGPKGVLDLNANVLNLLGLDLNLLGPKGVLKLGAQLPNTPSASAPSPPSPDPTKLPLNPATLNLLLKLFGPNAVLALLSKVLGPGLLVTLLKSVSKPCSPPKCCPCPQSAPALPGGIIDLEPTVINTIASDALLDVDLALVGSPTLEVPASPVSSIYEIYGNGYDPIMPICTKTCTVPVVSSVRASPCSTSLRSLRTIRPCGPLAKLIQAPDATSTPPESSNPKDVVTQVPPVPNPTDALPQVPPTDALPVEDDPKPLKEASPLSSPEISTALNILKSLPKSGETCSLAKSLSQLLNIPPTIEEPAVEESVNSTTESVPTTESPLSTDTTETNESEIDTGLSSSESTGTPEFSLPLEPDAEFIDPSASTNLPQKMNLLSDSDSTCRRRFLETISQPVLKHFTYQLDLPH